MQIGPIEQKRLVEILLCAGRSQLHAEAIVHALVDLQEGFQTLFTKLVPEALSHDRTRAVEEIWWDIREEFRHIEYHMADAQEPDQRQ